MFESLFFEIGAIIVLATALSFVAYALRQPLILAYIVTGMLVGGSVLGIAESHEAFEALSQIGIAFLLFTVGLGLNWRLVRDVGGSALAMGLGQVLFTTIVGFPIARALGFDTMTSLFIAGAFAFSSTIIIVKMLADKDDLDTLYGRLAIGTLLVQDLIAMLVLLILGAVGSGETLANILAISLVKGLIAVLLLACISLWIVPHIVKYAARSQELLMLFGIGWCFLVAGALTFSGFGIEIGALLAGVSLSGTVFQREILNRVRHLRDFFLIIFFIVLGLDLNLATLDQVLLPALIFSLFILIGKPLIVLLITRLLGHHPRTGWLTGATFAQISEFSFIVIAVGVSLGLIETRALALTAAVGVFTIAGSTYLIHFNHRIYDWLQPALRRLEPKRCRRHTPKLPTAEIVLLGYHRMGSVLLPVLQGLKKRLLVIDNNPAVIDALGYHKMTAVYGDGGDEDFLADLQVHDAKLIVSTIPDLSVTTSLLKYLRRMKYRGIVIVTTKNQDEGNCVYALGASFVIVPQILGGEKFAELFQARKLVKKRWVSSSSNG